jgi:hypothetical protein
MLGQRDVSGDDKLPEPDDHGKDVAAIAHDIGGFRLLIVR